MELDALILFIWLHFGFSALFYSISGDLNGKT